MSELVSVVIPTFARPSLLSRAIDSVINQTYEDFEILIVDDNGVGTENQLITEEYIKRNYQYNNQIKYIKHDINLGGNAARNTGIKHAKGSFIGFLDDDDEWGNRFLEKMIPNFRSSNVGAVYCDYYTNISGNLYYMNRNSVNYSGNVYSHLLNGWCPNSTSLFVIKRECFEAVGYFDEKLKSFQDYDMWLRISRQYLFAFEKELLITKFEGYGGEQVGFNPYNRRKAWIDLKDKWESRLTEQETVIFHNFLSLHDKIIKANLIIYNKLQKNKVNYFRLYKDVLNSEKNLKQRIFLLGVCLFGTKMLKLKDVTFYRKYRVKA